MIRMKSIKHFKGLPNGDGLVKRDMGLPVYADAVVHDLNYPSTLSRSLRYAGYATAITFALFHILMIYKIIDIAKVAYSVVESVVVYMVNLIRPMSVDVEPCESVSQVSCAEHLDGEISFAVYTPSHVADLNTVRSSNQPSEYTAFFVVIEYLFQLFLRKFSLRRYAVKASATTGSSITQQFGFDFGYIPTRAGTHPRNRTTVILGAMEYGETIKDLTGSVYEFTHNILQWILSRLMGVAADLEVGVQSLNLATSQLYQRGN